VAVLTPPGVHDVLQLLHGQLLISPRGTMATVLVRFTDDRPLAETTTSSICTGASYQVEARGLVGRDQQVRGGDRPVTDEVCARRAPAMFTMPKALPVGRASSRRPTMATVTPKRLRFASTRGGDARSCPAGPAISAASAAGSPRQESRRGRQAPRLEGPEITAPEQTPASEARRASDGVGHAQAIRTRLRACIPTPPSAAHPRPARRSRARDDAALRVEHVELHAARVMR
jgi:hypothetical protein